jgi:ATP/maltotriose-dependent transcriptional regulator MalT
LREVEAAAEATGEPHIELNARTLRARLLLTQHRLDEAIEVTSWAIEDIPTGAMYGEYLAMGALSRAIAREHDASRTLLRKARKVTTAVEVRTLGAVVNALAAVDERGGGAAVMNAITVAVELESWEPLVCGSRAGPRLLRVLAVDERAKRHLVRVLTRSRDLALLRSVGLARKITSGRGGLLSRREQDVMDLLKQGLTNREIAKTLVISEATAKVHVQHILQKLRARTRAEAVARYAAEEASSGSSSGTDSSSG